MLSWHIINFLSCYEFGNGFVDYGLVFFSSKTVFLDLLVSVNYSYWISYPHFSGLSEIQTSGWI